VRSLPSQWKHNLGHSPRFAGGSTPATSTTVHRQRMQLLHLVKLLQQRDLFACYGQWTFFFFFFFFFFLFTNL
jgi:hypothetical protein